MSLEAVSTKRNRNLPQQLTLDHVSPATRLLEKRRQMFEVQEALDALEYVRQLDALATAKLDAAEAVGARADDDVIEGPTVKLQADL